MKVVAYTIRLLLKLGNVRAAKELDRAFFSTEGAEAAGPRASTSKEPYSERELEEKEEYRLGDGLGLSRSGICQAWMQSLALRLKPELYPTLDEFGTLLRQLRRVDDVAGDTRLAAFLVRKATQISTRMNPEERNEGDELVLKELLFFLEPARRKERSSILTRAVVESEMLRQEATPTEESLNSVRFHKMEKLARELLRDVDRQPIESVTGYDNREMLDGRAHTLYLGIRLLLLRAKIASSIPSDPSHRSTIVSQSIKSTLLLYDSLLSLLPVVLSSSRDQLELIRERQSSALYRILWACQGTFDVHLPRELPLEPGAYLADYEKFTRDAEENTPPANLQLLPFALTALNSTLSALPLLSSLTSPLLPRHHPALINVSVLYWRRLLYALSLPSCPSRRAPPLPPAQRPPWPTLKATINMLKACRDHDSSLEPSSVDPEGAILKPGQDPSAPSHTQAIFIRRSLVIHLVRATLLGGMDPREQGEESPEERLWFLLEFLEAFKERKVRRTVLREATGIILEREFQGPVWEKRKEAMKRFMGEWCEQGQVEDRKDSEDLAKAAVSLFASAPRADWNSKLTQPLNLAAGSNVALATSFCLSLPPAIAKLATSPSHHR